MRATSFTHGYAAFSESKIRKNEISRLYSQMKRIWHRSVYHELKDARTQNTLCQYFRLEVSDCASMRHLDRNTKLSFQVHRTKNVAMVCICCNPRIDGNRKIVPGGNYDTKQHANKPCVDSKLPSSTSDASQRSHMHLVSPFVDERDSFRLKFFSWRAVIFTSQAVSASTGQLFDHWTVRILVDRRTHKDTQIHSQSWYTCSSRFAEQLIRLTLKGRALTCRQLPCRTRAMTTHFNGAHAGNPSTCASMLA